MIVCHGNYFQNTEFSSLYFHSSQKILYNHRIVFKIVTTFYLILNNLLHKGNTWEHLSEFLRKSDPFMGLIFRKK